jgi:rfaE bifunctional protein nucleotidyltransferase chain/domain
LGKLVSLEQLADIVTQLKKEGKTIAQCHGCFDLMHPGHIKHFQSAAKIADVLIVTVTQDKYVNKGPGRPVFNEQIRAESIASLECVHYVAINKWPTAIETIHLLQPNFYVKGPDYKIRTNDVTSNISLEEQAVMEHGGKLHITEDETMSSSQLINAHFSHLDDAVQKYRENLKAKFSAEAIIDMLHGLSQLKVLVVGDTIIDEYHSCTPLGKSSKSPTISTIYRSGVSYAGGALAIANHLEQFAGKVKLVTLLGEQKSQLDFIESKLPSPIERKYFFRPDGPTPTKRRYIDTYLNLKLFEVTFMNDKLIDEELEGEIIRYLQSVIQEFDLILVADFGHGFIAPGIIQFLEKTNKFLAINAQTNSNNFGFNYITKYKRADYISIDEKELRLPFGDAYGSVEELICKLSKITRCHNIQITLGAAGSVIYQNNTFVYTPAFATSVKDSVGAGDAVLSISSLCTFANVPVEVTGFVSNCAGSLAVNILGNEHPVYKKDLLKFISHFLK